MELPDKPSELILLALNDLKKCEADPGYEIGMDEWHQPLYYNVCEVCFAGAVMAKTLGAEKRISKVPECYKDKNNNNKLRALNYFRIGNVRDGMVLMGLDFPIIEWGVADYRHDPKEFHKDMEALAAYLKRHGL